MYFGLLAYLLSCTINLLSTYEVNKWIWCWQKAEMVGEKGKNSVLIAEIVNVWSQGMLQSPGNQNSVEVV